MTPDQARAQAANKIVGDWWDLVTDAQGTRATPTHNELYDLANRIATALRAARGEALLLACQKICGYCASTQFWYPSLPDRVGGSTFYHARKDNDSKGWCEAYSIRALMAAAALDAGKEG